MNDCILCGRKARLKCGPFCSKKCYEQMLAKAKQFIGKRNFHPW